jgi:tetratricopeptide (TPR) repeat protein
MNLARSHSHTAFVLSNTNRVQLAKEHYEKALALDQGLVAQFPDYAPYRQDLAACYRELGKVLVQLAQLPQAEKHYRRSLELWNEAIAQKPRRDTDYRAGRAETWYFLGYLLHIENRFADAEKAYRDAVQSYRELRTEFPEVGEYRKGLAFSLSNLADLLATTHRHAEAAPTFDEALLLLEKLTTDFPRMADHQFMMANTVNNQGDSLKQQQFTYTLACLHQPPLTCVALLRLQQAGITRALPRFERAYELQRQVVESQPSNPSYQLEFWTLGEGLARSVIELGNHARGMEVIEELSRTPGANNQQLVSTARLTARCLALARSDIHLTPSQREQLVTHYAHQGLHLLRQALKQGDKDAGKLKNDPALEPLRSVPEFEELWKPPAGTR